jgi:hypothetical protein|nr:MAG TPA: hypothetical protein [Caudoviricetes sp.]
MLLFLTDKREVNNMNNEISFNFNRVELDSFYELYKKTKVDKEPVEYNLNDYITYISVTEDFLINRANDKETAINLIITKMVTLEALLVMYKWGEEKNIKLEERLINPPKESKFFIRLYDILLTDYLNLKDSCKEDWCFPISSSLSFKEEPQSIRLYYDMTDQRKHIEKTSLIYLYESGKTDVFEITYDLSNAPLCSFLTNLNNAMEKIKNNKPSLSSFIKESNILLEQLAVLNFYI